LATVPLARRISRPVERLTDATRRFGEGDLSARVKTHGDDELARLSRSWNEMADRIERLVVGQRELLANVSHELRSPLARLMVALELAREQAGEAAREPLERIERESARLNDLIGRLLTLARIQAASDPPEHTEVSLRKLMEEIAADARFEATSRGAQVTLQAPPGDCVVVGAPDLLRSAIENVVRNALRYTPSDRTVEMRLECPADEPAMALISIRDHGPGVPEEELAHLFRPFYRVASARDRDSGGAGLGLAITREAARLHGGSVLARDVPGGGLEVQIKLPLAESGQSSVVSKPVSG
jgi:two-component system sensor histidine kinase CpxA